MNPKEEGVLAGTSLSDINTIINQKEAEIGPLIGMGNDGTNTVLTFDANANAPDQGAVVAADTDGVPNIPHGSTKVCAGMIYISGTPTAATATRPN